MKDRETRLVIEIDRSLHHKIKMLALERHMTIKSFVILAIARELQNEPEREELS